MIDELNQNSEGSASVQDLRQFLLDQLSEQQTLIGELSNEELETIAGGVNVTYDIEEAVTAHAGDAADPKKTRWIDKSANRIAVGGPIVSSAVAGTVGFINSAITGH